MHFLKCFFKYSPTFYPRQLLRNCSRDNFRNWFRYFCPGIPPEKFQELFLLVSKSISRDRQSSRDPSFFFNELFKYFCVISEKNFYTILGGIFDQISQEIFLMKLHEKFFKERTMYFLH